MAMNERPEVKKNMVEKAKDVADATKIAAFASIISAVLIAIPQIAPKTTSLPEQQRDNYKSLLTVKIAKEKNQMDKSIEDHSNEQLNPNKSLTKDNNDFEEAI
jgi:hypothetical protein